MAAASGAGVGRSPSASKIQGFIQPGSAIWNKKIKENISVSYTKKKHFLDLQKFPFQQPAPERHRLYQNWWVESNAWTQIYEKDSFDHHKASANSSLIGIKFNREWERLFPDQRHIWNQACSGQKLWLKRNQPLKKLRWCQTCHASFEVATEPKFWKKSDKIHWPCLGSMHYQIAG